MDVSLLIKNRDGTHLIHAEWYGFEEPPVVHAEALDGAKLTKRCFRWIGWDRTRPKPTPLYMEVSLPAYRKAKSEALKAANERKGAEALS